jgi:hypothetical protein
MIKTGLPLRLSRIVWINAAELFLPFNSAVGGEAVEDHHIKSHKQKERIAHI